MRIPWRFDPRIASELKAQRVPILQGLAFTALASGLYALTIPLVKVATNTVSTLASRADASTKDLALVTLAEVCLGVVGVFLLRYVFLRAQGIALGRAGNLLTADLRSRLMAKLMRLPVSYFSDRRSGSIQSVLTNDVGVYNSAIAILRDSIEAPVKAITAFAAILFTEWRLAIVTIFMLPLMVLVISRNARKVRVAQTAVQSDLGELAGNTQEMLQGVRVVKAFGAEGTLSKQYEAMVAETYQSQMKAVTLTASLRPLVELIGAVALAIFFYVGGRLALTGATIGGIVSLAMAMDVINQGFRALSSASNTYSSVQAAADRIYGEILDVPEAHEGAGGKRLSSVAGRIRFENVGFVYPDGTRALRDLSFELDPGQSLALVGPSGAGKSTIADLLLRFYDPTEGRITLDGVPLIELDPVWYRTHVGIVPQSTFLFAGTIEENVRMGRSAATREEVGAALRAAHADDFTREFEGRDLAELGERGMRLSGGQMQRVAIARALVRDPEILLLDEATSALDAASENAVNEALVEAMQCRSTLTIAHRLTTAARSDRILVLREGAKVEEGTHDSLLQENGEYAAMFRLFSGGRLDD